MVLSIKGTVLKDAAHPTLNAEKIMSQADHVFENNTDDDLPISMKSVSSDEGVMPSSSQSVPNTPCTDGEEDGSKSFSTLGASCNTQESSLSSLKSPSAVVQKRKDTQEYEKIAQQKISAPQWQHYQQFKREGFPRNGNGCMSMLQFLVGEASGNVKISRDPKENPWTKGVNTSLHTPYGIITGFYGIQVVEILNLERFHEECYGKKPIWKTFIENMRRIGMRIRRTGAGLILFFDCKMLGNFMMEGQKHSKNPFELYVEINGIKTAIERNSQEKDTSVAQDDSQIHGERDRKMAKLTHDDVNKTGASGSLNMSNSQSASIIVNSRPIPCTMTLDTRSGGCNGPWDGRNGNGPAVLTSTFSPIPKMHALANSKPAGIVGTWATHGNVISLNGSDQNIRSIAMPQTATHATGLGTSSIPQGLQQQDKGDDDSSDSSFRNNLDVLATVASKTPPMARKVDFNPVYLSRPY